jgi:lipoyl(octanoyl) transferase
VDYVRKLEEVLIRACADYGILTQRIAGRTGVWTEAGGRVLEKKLAAIGVHISRFVTSHGFALNVTADLKDFAYIVPCGIADRQVTSMEEEMDLRIHALPNLDQVANSIARHFSRVFAQPVLWVESLDELERTPAGSS